VAGPDIALIVPLSLGGVLILAIFTVLFFKRRKKAMSDTAKGVGLQTMKSISSRDDEFREENEIFGIVNAGTAGFVDGKEGNAPLKKETAETFISERQSLASEPISMSPVTAGGTGPFGMIEKVIYLLFLNFGTK